MKIAKMLVLIAMVIHFVLSAPSRVFAGEGGEEAEIQTDTHLDIPAAGSKIKIDGILEEEAWKKAAQIDLPYEWSPGENIGAPVKTTCFVTYSQSKLYIAFQCFDPEPGKIRAHLMNRDTINTFIQDDYVSVMLDTYNDERLSYQFRVNPLGVQVDAIFNSSEAVENFSWDATWNSRGKINESGYVVEIAIPFNQVRFSRDEGEKLWGFSAERSYPRSARHRMGSHRNDRNIQCIACQFNKITGFKGIVPGKNVELAPTVTVTRTDKRDPFPAGKMEAGDIDSNLGLTASWGISPNIMATAAVNPDFSHVEADVAQLEVNTRFALRYPEKRPFFVEGMDFYSTPLEAVFTRTIYDPVWGIKFTGKMDKNALAVFATQDNYTTLLFPSNQGSAAAAVTDDVYGGVFRYRRDVGKGSTIGLLYTGRVGEKKPLEDPGENYYNHVGGFDTFFRLTKTKIFEIQFLRSFTRYPGSIAAKYNQPGDAIAGNALFTRFQHYSRTYYYFLTYEYLNPDFRADFGFIPRVDTKHWEGGITRAFWGKRGSWFERIGFMIRMARVTDHDNLLTNQEIEFSGKYQGPLQSTLQQKYFIKKERYAGTMYDFAQYRTYLDIKPIGGMEFSITLTYGDTIDYSNFRLARLFYANPALEIALGKNMNINLNYIIERLSLPGRRIYTANLAQARFVYNINVRTFFRAIVQYTRVDRNMDLYIRPVTPLTKVLFTQFLFSYKVNPQTVLFIGYSDNSSGTLDYDITRSDRTFFLKIGYALGL